GAARGHVVAVADARLRGRARPDPLLPAPRRGAGGPRRPGAAYGPGAVSLDLRDVTVRFGGVSALAGVSFSVAPDAVTSLIGPNGAGKTTAFNVITGFQRPAAGEVRWEGRSLAGLRPWRVAARGLVRTFQKTSVFPGLSVLDNVLTALHL